MKKYSKTGLWKPIAATILASVLVFGALYKTGDKRKKYISAIPAGYELEQVTDANRMLLDFPSEVPGARNVDKYLTPDAKYCLVHLRQAHKVKSDFLYSKYSKERKKINEVQDDIKSILEYLIINENLQTIYYEGLPFGDEETIIDSLKDEFSKTGKYSLSFSEYYDLHERDELEAIDRYLEAIENHNRENIIIPLAAFIDSSIENLRKYRDNLEQEVQENNVEFVRSAGVELSIDGKLNIIGAEDCESHKKALSQSSLNEVVMDDREDALLNIISIQENPIALTVYGAAHAWGGTESFGKRYVIGERISHKDNISEWNKLHPNAKFSLIEITPKSMTYFEDYSE